MNIFTNKLSNIELSLWLIACLHTRIVSVAVFPSFRSLFVFASVALTKQHSITDRPSSRGLPVEWWRSSAAVMLDYFWTIMQDSFWTIMLDSFWTIMLDSFWTIMQDSLFGWVTRTLFHHWTYNRSRSGLRVLYRGLDRFIPTLIKKWSSNTRMSL